MFLHFFFQSKSDDKVPSMDRKPSLNQERKILASFSKASNQSPQQKGKTASMQDYYLEEVDEIRGGEAPSKQNRQVNIFIKVVLNCI